MGSTANLSPRLLAFSDQEHHSGSVGALCDLCVEALPGQVVIVLRDRGLSARRRLAMGEELLVAARRGGQMLVVSDRADLARALGADGLHLPAVGFSPTDADSAWNGPSQWLSRAGHGLERLGDAELAVLSAVIVSPVWEPRKGRSALGESGLRQRVHDVKGRGPHLAIYALGGVSAENAAKSFECGADGVAAMGALTDVRQRARLLSALEICR